MQDKVRDIGVVPNLLPPLHPLPKLIHAVDRFVFEDRVEYGLDVSLRSALETAAPVLRQTRLAKLVTVLEALRLFD
jgi:hypothetical protein